MFIDVAVLSSTAVIRVVREGNVRQLVQEPNAHDSSTFDASLVRNKIRVENTHGSRVEDRPSGGPCAIVGGSQT